VQLEITQEPDAPLEAERQALGPHCQRVANFLSTLTCCSEPLLKRFAKLHGPSSNWVPRLVSSASFTRGDRTCCFIPIFTALFRAAESLRTKPVDSSAVPVLPARQSAQQSPKLPDHSRQPPRLRFVKADLDLAKKKAPGLRWGLLFIRQDSAYRLT